MILNNLFESSILKLTLNKLFRIETSCLKSNLPLQNLVNESIEKAFDSRKLLPSAAFDPNYA